MLALVTAGLRNPQIADKLVLSVRTVEHHVEAILTKLGVSTRIEICEMVTNPGPATQTARSTAECSTPKDSFRPDECMSTRTPSQ